MKRHALLLSAMLLSATSVAASIPPDCKLSVYALDAKQSSLGKRIIGPDQVASVALVKTNIPEVGTNLQVRLTESGAAANRDYSSKNIGKKTALLCNGKEVARPTIQGQSGATFVVSWLKWP